MPGYVKVKFELEGVYPADDIDMIATAYGCPEGQDKLAFCIAGAKVAAIDGIAKYLGVPSDQAITAAKEAELAEARAALQTRISNQITATATSEIING